MPNEFRFLVFSDNETANAMVAFAPRAGKKLPIGSVKGVVINSDKELPWAELVLSPDDGGEIKVPFANGELTAALIGWCINNKVPLPRNGEKVLEELKGKIALRIGMHPGKEEDLPV